jgi:hypothetical protein
MSTLNAAIVELNVSTWTARKLDKNASKEVKVSKGANSDDAARVNKNLLAGMNNLKRVTDFVALTRNEFYRLTLPWSDSGQRLVPMMQFFELKKWVNDSEATFNQLVAEFLRDYPTLISAQAFQLGALFDRNEFPDVADIATKFRFKVGFLPLPSTGDFRIDAPNEVLADMQKQYEAMYTERMEQVNQDLWTRLHDTLKHMSDRLGYDTTGKAKIFRDSMVENAVELCDMLKRLNVTNDPKLEKARAGLESALLGVDATEIRTEGARDEIKHKVDTVIADWF